MCVLLDNMLDTAMNVGARNNDDETALLVAMVPQHIGGGPPSRLGGQKEFCSQRRTRVFTLAFDVKDEIVACMAR